jgi:hypothetical protein
MRKLKDFESRFIYFLVLVVGLILCGALLLVIAFFEFEAFVYNILSMFPYAPLSNMGAAILFIVISSVWVANWFFKCSYYLWAQESKRFVLELAAERFTGLWRDC